ncbi:hypothetical protein Scep_030199 [Stephania cephalantha]|uniref:Uncharacterized protein n=1 Tax=Stephania cephalantha TaxID=152367 RepID=A0AAP0HCY8_9MAGN
MTKPQNHGLVAVFILGKPRFNQTDGILPLLTHLLSPPLLTHLPLTAAPHSRPLTAGSSSHRRGLSSSTKGSSVSLTAAFSSSSHRRLLLLSFIQPLPTHIPLSAAPHSRPLTAGSSSHCVSRFTPAPQPPLEHSRAAVGRRGVTCFTAASPPPFILLTSPRTAAAESIAIVVAFHHANRCCVHRRLAPLLLLRIIHCRRGG